MSRKAAAAQATAPPTEPASPTTPGQRLLLVLFGLALLVLAVASIEGMLALMGVAETERFVDPYVGFEEGASLFALAGQGETQRYVTRPDKLKFFNHQEFPATKVPGTYRVFTLGGSTTAGRPYDDQVSFSRWLERYLDAAEPSRRHQVINAGAISYASYRIVVLMKELVRYEPDLFVVLTGHNEFLEERTYRDLVAQPEVLKWMHPRLSRLRLSHLIWGAMAQDSEDEVDQLPDEVQTRLDVWTGLAAYERDDALRRSISEHFAFNLQQMVDLARAHGVDLVLVKPACNLKDFSPFKSDHREGLTAAERRRFLGLLSEGKERLATADAATALAAFTTAQGIDPEYAELSFRLGQAHLQLGDFEAAERDFGLAKELDIAPLRSLDSLLDQIDRTARQQQVPMVDLPALLEAENMQRLGHRILGNEVFLDHVHPDIATHSLIAEQLMETLVEAGKVRLDATWNDAQRRAIYDSVVSSLDAEYYARRDLNLAKVLGWAGKLEEAEPPLRRAAAVLDGDPDLHLNLGILWQKTGRPMLALAQLERAVALDPESAEAHFNLGVTYGHLGRLREGIEALEKALQRRAEYPEAHHNLSLLYRLSGDAEAAIHQARLAVALRPTSPEIHLALGLAYRQAGRFAEARAAFGDSLRLAPAGDAPGADAPGAVAPRADAPGADAPGADATGDGTARTELGITLAMEGRLDEAAVELERAIVDAPNDAAAHYNLARIATQGGRLEEAAKLYGRALELRPRHILAHNNLALLRARQGQLEAARRHLEQALEIDPLYAEAWLNLGVVYDMARQPEAAIRAVQQALELRPDDPKIHLGLAMLYWTGGRRDAALPHFQVAHDGGEAVPPEVLLQLTP